MAERAAGELTVPRPRPVGHTAVAAPAAGELTLAPMAHRTWRWNCAATLPLGRSPSPSTNHIRMAPIPVTRIGPTSMAPALRPAAAMSTVRYGAEPICIVRPIRRTMTGPGMTAIAVPTRKDLKSISAPVYRSCDGFGPRACRHQPRGNHIVRYFRANAPNAAVTTTVSGLCNCDRHFRAHRCTVARPTQCPARLRGLPSGRGCRHLRTTATGGPVAA
jgi:hypothetical protein